jgi:glycosyltransferase involved in cell wall biosynthesis
VVTVGDVVERKNHALLVAVWSQLIAAGSPEVPCLVVAGRIGPDQVSLVQRVQRSPSLRARVRFMPNVSDETLTWLYGNCRFTLFPSRREGFGLPVAESLAFGKLCVASSAEAIPEASQDLAIHLDPGDEPGWRTTIARLLADPGELADREARIRRRFRRSTWRDTAADMLAAVHAHLEVERPSATAPATETAPR